MSGKVSAILDRDRIASDLVIIRALAHRYIHDVLWVPDSVDDYRFRDRLTATHRFIPPSALVEIQASGSVLKRRFGLDGVEVDIGLWPNAAFPPFKGMQLRVQSAHNGVVSVSATDSAGALSLAFIFNYVERRAHPDLMASSVLQDRRFIDQAISLVKYRCDAIKNGVVEFTFQNGEKLLCEAVMPVNVDVAGTLRMWERQLDHLLTMKGA